MAAQRDMNAKMFQMLSKQIHKNGIEAQQEAMKTGEKIADVSHRIEAAEEVRKAAQETLSKQMEANEIKRMAAQEELSGQINKGFNAVTEDVSLFKKQVQFAFDQQNRALCGLVKCLKDVQLELRNVHTRCQLLDDRGNWQGPGFFASATKNPHELTFVPAPQIKNTVIETKQQFVEVG